MCTSIWFADLGDDRRQRLDAALCAVELAAAVVADDQRVGAGLHRQLRVLDVLDALQDQLAAPALLDPLHVAPVELRVELLGRPLREAAHVAHALDVADDVAELAPLRAQHAQAPARLGGHVDQVGDRQLRRGAEAVLQVLVALAEDLQVQRQHQRVALGRPWRGRSGLR
jgi:hypothetical protein